MIRIYGKYKGQKQFKPMDLNAGIQVTNLIYASLLTKEEADKFMEKEAPLNAPDWKFEAREVA